MDTVSPTANTTASRKSKLTKASTPSNTGAVKIVLHTANNDVDEKAEVTVSLSNPEDAVEKMLHTLAQRFPPESVMTIASTKGGAGGVISDGSGSSSSQQNTQSRSFSSDSELAANQRMDQVSGAREVSEAAMKSSIPGLPAEIRAQMARLPSDLTSWILANDPAILSQLVAFARTGADSRGWATALGLHQDQVAHVIQHMMNNPAFASWVLQLSELQPSGKKGRSRRSRSHHRRHHHSQVFATQGQHGAWGSYYSQSPAMPPVRPPSNMPSRVTPPQSGIHMTQGGGSMIQGSPVLQGSTVIQGGSVMQGGSPSNIYSGGGYPSLALPNTSPHGSVGQHTSIHRIPSGPSGGEYITQTGEYMGGQTIVSQTGGQSMTGSQSIIGSVGPNERVEIMADGTRVRYVEVEMVEWHEINQSRVEYKEVEKRVPIIEEREIEKIVEVPEVQWVEKYVQGEPRYEEVEKLIEKEEVVEVPKVIEISKPVQRKEIIERTREVPQLIEVPKPYPVEQRVPVPHFVNKEVPTVVAQKLKPIIKQQQRITKVPAKTYEPVFHVVDLFVPLPVSSTLVANGKLEETHKIVEVPPAQYNSLLKTMNLQLEEQAISDLYVRGANGIVPMLPAGELSTVVPPIPGAFQNQYHTAPRSKSRSKSHRKSHSPSRRHRHH